MCAVSAVYNWAQELPENTWVDRTDLVHAFEALVAEAGFIDDMMGVIDCAVGEEKKKAFLKKIQELAYKGGTR